MDKEENEENEENEEKEENEEYTPKEVKYYNYKAKEDCLLYFSDAISSFNNVNIFAYKVNNSASTPFLNILLHKQKGVNTLMLPQVPIFKNIESDELINYSKICLFGLCLLDNFDKFVETLIFNGFYIFDNNLYLFFDITNCNIKVNDIYSNTPIWFGLIDEIVNHKHICNIKIEENVTKLFTLNDKLCFLNDENDESYEIPVLGFIGTNKNKASFKSIFGEPAQNKNAILGPYFYFTNFSNVFTNKEHEYIVRFALFIGKIKYIENKVDDPIDESEIKQQRLQDTSFDENIERLTMRITDHDGNWAKTFDSVYLGCLELDNGEYLRDTPLIVVRDYEQQIPLGYHYINKNY